MKVSVTLFDTRLLAPAGAGSLRALGELLEFDKLSLPDVLDETGKTRPGIERMDLTLVQHPEAFNAYAVRDAEIAVEWFLRVNELRQTWGLTKPAHTIGSMAVAKFEQLVKTLPDFDLLSFSASSGSAGRIEPLDELLAVRRLAADCFHGGRNECFEHGVYRTPAFDWDLKGAYTSALAMFRQLDWSANRTHNRSQPAGGARCRDLRAREVPVPARYALPVVAGRRGRLWPDLSAVGRELRDRPGVGGCPGAGRDDRGHRRRLSCRGRTPTGHARFWSSRKSSTRNGPGTPKARRWSCW